MDKFIYYPGCIGESCSRQIDKVSRLVMQKLRMEFAYLPEMSCCGGVSFQEQDEFQSNVLNGRNFALAEKEGMDIVTICNTCLYIMSYNNKNLIQNPMLRQKVNHVLKDSNLHYSGDITISHLLWHITDVYGIEKLEKLIKTKLKDIKVAPFYGCHIIRPKKLLGIDHDFSKNNLDVLIKSLGAVFVDHDLKESCCGFHVHKIKPNHVEKMVEEILNSAKEADVIVTPCTECHFTLDFFGSKLKNKKPVIHFTQLIGLALGMTEKELELKNNFVSLKEVIKKIPKEKKEPIEKPKEKQDETEQKKKPEKQEIRESSAQYENQNDDLKVDRKFSMDDAKNQIMKNE